jgi:hypothetical protein
MTATQTDAVRAASHQGNPAGRGHLRTIRRLIATGLGLSLAVVTGLVGSPPRASAQDAIMTLRPSDMSYTQTLRPAHNFSGSTMLKISRTQFHTYLAYDLSGLADPAVIVSASLELHIGRSGATKPALLVRQTAPDWTAATLTHWNRPLTSTTVLNPADTSTPAAHSSVGVPLDLSAARLGTRLSMVLSYQRPYTGIQLFASDPPTLRLVLRPKRSAERTAGPSALPYPVAPVASSGRKVFAHYFPPYPISIDNQDPSTDYYTRNYLNPSGEKGKFRQVGGLLRDRPLGRSPLAGDYRLTDAMTEVRQAASAGIDGFTVNILNWSGSNWDQSLLMAKAASQSRTGFVTIPNIDLTSAARKASVDTIAARLNAFYAQPSAYRLPDGRYVLSSFKAEARPPSWWKDVASVMDRRYGKRIAFIAVFLDLSEARIRSYRSVSYAMSIWGMRTPESVRRSPDRARKVHKAGVKWMAPIAVQDVRHRTRTYAEAGNTETLRASWKRALADKADMVQLITWNDYSESTHFAPSVAHGTAFLDLNGFYATQFKNRRPPITGDQVIVTHRIQSHTHQPTDHSWAMSPKLSGSLTKPRDTVEVVTLLKASATVMVRVGSKTATYVAPPGMHPHLVPLSRGHISVSVVRAGRTVASVASPHRVTSKVTRWDLQYYAASSRTR